MDLINRDEAMAICDKYNGIGSIWACIKGDIRLLPSAQPEIIPCKDCKYGEIDDPDFPNEYFCRFKGFDWNGGEHYCSDAKRRTG